jgi:hypothetical protein
VIYHRFRPITETYTNKEREKVLHFLAFNLLLARDGLYQTTTGGGQQSLHQHHTSQDIRVEVEREESLIKRLQTELSIQTNVKRFYSLNYNSDEQSPTADDSCGDGGLEMGEIERKSQSQREQSQSSSSTTSSFRLSRHLSSERVLNPLATAALSVTTTTSPKEPPLSHS